MRALFITSTRLGDAVLSTGALDALLARSAEPRITVACGPVAAPIFQNVEGVERVLTMTKGRFGAHWRRLWSAVVGTRWDIVVDLRGSALTWTVLAGERRVYRTPQEPGHRVDQIAAALGLDPVPAPRLWISDQDRRGAAKVLGDDPGPLLVVAPTANWPPKAWSGERFVELVNRLTDGDGPLSGARVVIAGGPGEAALAAPVVTGLGPERCIDLVGRVPLMTLAACLSRARLVVANDSGLMHVAAAAGAPTLGLFGPSDERRYAPRGPFTAWVRAPDPAEDLLARSGEVADRAGALMGGVSVDAVAAAAGDLLRKAGA